MNGLGDGNDSIVLNWKNVPNKTKNKKATVTNQENQHILHCNGVYLEHVLCIGRVLFESSTAAATSIKNTVVDSCARKYNGFWGTASLIFKEEGMRGFVRGTLARTLTHAPAAAFSWTA